MPGDPEPVGLLLGDDDALLRRLAHVGGGVYWQTAPVPGREPAVLVIDLERPRAVDEVVSWRERCPDAYVVGYLAAPRQDLWLEASRAGCDLVTNRGALTVRLRRRLAAGGFARRRRRYPVVETAEVPGRLGLVLRLPDSPVGPMAVYHVEGRLFGVCDVCPHAGALLSEGELDGAVVTCPRHGSQFDVRTGERVRGPADRDIVVHRLVDEDGYVQLVLDQE